jgi:adenylate kinase family enzyme
MPKRRSSDAPEYRGINRYSYIVNAELKSEEKDVLVRREKWRDNHLHVAARDSKGRFIATRKWSKKEGHTIKSFEYKYKSHPITLKITSTKKYDMRNKRNKSLIFNRIKEKYSKYPLRDAKLAYRYCYDSATGMKV